MKIWREIRLPMGIIGMIAGIFFLIISIVWIFFGNKNLSLITEISKFFGNWNYYLLVAGIVLFPLGSWYTYDYFKKRRYLIEEMKTDKKSELVKKRAELKAIARKLPKKYEKMLVEKEEKLGLR